MNGVLRGLARGVALLAGIFVATATQADVPLVFEYHGWHVDLTGAKGAESAAKMVHAVKQQLDIIEHVDLKPDVVDFMRTIPIWANPHAATAGPGHYGHLKGVDLRVRRLDPHKPIILHEMLHAYHDRKLPEGFKNPDVMRFYERGKTVGWPADSYMLTNNREFFAVTASVYLFGDIRRAPWSRNELRAKQPRYYQWLADLFDDGHPRP